MARRGTGTIDRLASTDPTLAFEQTLREIEVARRKRSRRRRTRIVLAIVLVPTLAAGTFVLTQRGRSTEVSLDEVTKRFRTSDSKTEVASPVKEPDEAIANEQEQVSGPAASEKVASDATTTSAPSGPYEPPSEGVYTYRAKGGEQVSILGAHHDYPERVYATVRHLDGCRWEHRNEVIKEHVDRRVWCSQAGQLTQILQGREVEFFGQRDGSVATCSPPMVIHKVGDGPGTTYEGVCTGEDTKAMIRRRIVDDKDFVVGGKSVEAIHIRIDSTFTGMATGTSNEDLWLDSATGMTLRWDRVVDTDANSAFGNVHYYENASFVLESLVPTT
jgi:hypothetical protein